MSCNFSRSKIHCELTQINGTIQQNVLALFRSRSSEYKFKGISNSIPIQSIINTSTDVVFSSASYPAKFWLRILQLNTQ